MAAVTAPNLLIPGAGLPNYGIPVFRSSLCPFSVSLNGDPDNTSNLKVSFRYGSVNHLIPTNINSQLNVSNSGTFYAKIRASTNGSVVTSSQLVVDGNLPNAQTPTPNSLPVTYEILLYVIQDGIAYRVINCGSISLVGVKVFDIDRVPAAQAGQSTTIPYYIWQLSTI